MSEPAPILDYHPHPEERSLLSVYRSVPLYLRILIGLILGLIARSGIKRPIFRETTAELKKDREWLKNLETNQKRS